MENRMESDPREFRAFASLVNGNALDLDLDGCARLLEFLDIDPTAAASPADGDETELPDGWTGKGAINEFVTDDWGPPPLHSKTSGRGFEFCQI